MGREPAAGGTPLNAGGLVAPRAHPVALMVEHAPRRSRLSTLVRLLLVLPHYVYATVWASVVAVTAVLAWVAILVTGRHPDGLWNFGASFLRYAARVQCYRFLVTDPFAPFVEEAPYPATLELRREDRQSRVAVLFRLVLAVPALILAWLLPWLSLPTFLLAWVAIVVSGRAPRGLVAFQAAMRVFVLRLVAYLALLTDTYPTFEGSPLRSAASPA